MKTTGNMKQQCPEFPFFGARYPDARCVDGYLFDLDDCDSNGNLYDLGYDVPCPFCNKEKFLESYGAEAYNEIVSWVKKHDPDYECEYVEVVEEENR